MSDLSMEAIRRALTLAREAEIRARMDDPARDRRRLAKTVRVSMPDSTDEERAVEVERLFKAVRTDPQGQGRMIAMRRALEAGQHQ